MANRILPVKAMSVSRSFPEMFWPTTPDQDVQPAGAEGRSLPSRRCFTRRGRWITFFTRYDKRSPASMLRPPNLAAMLATQSRLSRAVLRVEQSHRPALLRAPTRRAGSAAWTNFKPARQEKCSELVLNSYYLVLRAKDLPINGKKSALQAVFFLRAHGSSL